MYKTIEAGAGQSVSQQIVSGLGSRRKREGETEILHEDGEITELKKKRSGKGENGGAPVL